MSFDRSVDEQKKHLRASLKASRANIEANQRKAADRAIRERLLSLSVLQRAKSVFCFVSTAAEVDTHRLIDILLAQEKTLAIPKITNPSHMLAIEFPGWQSLQPGALGIPSPPGQQPLSDRFDITLTPGLGFTEDGDRLGYGRGYYDQWFRENHAGVKIALAYECQVCEDIPSNERDVKVDIILTEKRIIRVAAP